VLFVLFESILSLKVDSKVSDLNFGDSQEDTFENAYRELRTFDKLHGSGSSSSSEHDGGGGGGGSGFLRNKRLYNTSIALTASFFSFYVPPRTKPTDTIDLANQVSSRIC